CARPHGHSYRVEVELCADELDVTGFVVDFGELAPLGRYLDEHLDHRDLNELLDQPSSELLARHLYNWCRAHLPEQAAAALQAVRVSETVTSWAEYRPAHTATVAPTASGPHGG